LGKQLDIQQLKDGKIFSVQFVKRTNGETRNMLARTGVTSHLNGVGRNWKDSDHNLLTVFDMQKVAYRCIPLDAIIKIKHHGKEYKV